MFDSNNEKKISTDIINNGLRKGGYLTTRFVIVTFLIENKKNKVAEILELVNCKIELNIVGGYVGEFLPADIISDITLYSSLDGYDKETSLLVKIETVLSKLSNRERNTPPVVIRIKFGFVGIVDSYVLQGRVFKISSYRDIGKRCQAWKFELINADQLNNEYNPISKRATRFYYGKNNKEGKPVSKYLDILKDIYTPYDPNDPYNENKIPSLLDDKYYSLKLDDSLRELLDVEIESNKKLNNNTIVIKFSDSDMNVTKNKNMFGNAVNDFWSIVQSEGGPLANLQKEGKYITTVFEEDSGAIRSILTVKNRNEENTTKKYYTYIDNSVIQNVEIVEAAIIKFTTLFDPSVFSNFRKGVLVRTKYFTSLVLSSSIGVLSSGADIILDRNANLRETNNNKSLPVWVIVSYKINFNTTSAAVCTTDLILSRTPILYNYKQA